MNLRLEESLLGVSRCPHCGIADPFLRMLWRSENLRRSDQRLGRNWATYLCASCFSVVLVRTALGNEDTKVIDAIFPNLPKVSGELPDTARNYLGQALGSLHSPDGAAMLSGAAVDAMLKAKGLESGSVYERIEKAVDEGVLTRDMAEWAHEVRLGSNRPRHADKDRPHVTREEAGQSVEFARVLGQVLFVLPASIARGKKAAAEQVS